MQLPAQLHRFLQQVQAIKTEHIEWLMTNLASPVAPLAWFASLQPKGLAARGAVQGLKGAAVVVWAVGFIWLWFLLFGILLLWESFLVKE